MNSKHNSFPSSFTKPLISKDIHKLHKAFKLISCQEDFVSIFPIIKASLNFANNAINPFSRI